ncbi:MAG: hypothetical protein ABRQ38_27600 [Candidatus Eremiobacterota bacterium]
MAEKQKPKKKTELEKWTYAFELIKENYKGTIEPEGKTVKLTGTSKGKELLVIPQGSNVHFALNLKSNFKLHLGTESFKSDWGKKLKLVKEITIGSQDFDSKFIIKGEPADKVVEFLSSDKIRSAIMCFEPLVSLEVTENILEIITKKDKEISDKKIDFLIERAVFLAEAIEKPVDITKEEEKPEIVYDKKRTIRLEQESKAPLSLEERVILLEKKVKDFEKEFDFIKSKIK